jgi:hypothetical protein
MLNRVPKQVLEQFQQALTVGFQAPERSLDGQDGRLGLDVLPGFERHLFERLDGGLADHLAALGQRQQVVGQALDPVERPLDLVDDVVGGSTGLRVGGRWTSLVGDRSLGGRIAFFGVEHVEIALGDRQGVAQVVRNDRGELL